MSARLAAGVVCALLACACAESRSGPEVELRIVNTDETAGSESPQQIVPQLATVQTVGGELVVRGIILVPDPCDDVHAHVAADGASAVLQIVARLSPRHAGRCDTAGEATLLHYQAAIRNLPGAAEHLRVLHDYQGLSGSGPEAGRWADHVAYDGPMSTAGGGP